MEYTVQKLARLAGVSPRTLRYYDEIDLLKPARLTTGGYRVYGQSEVDRLQQIMIYRELQVDLRTIKEIVTAPSFERTRALRSHRDKLLQKREQLNLLIATVEKTIFAAEGRTTMTDQEKFEGLRQRLIEENEEKYGGEIRAAYGDDLVERSYEKFRGLNVDAFAAAERLSQEIIEGLVNAMDTGNPASEAAQKTAALHRQWLSYYWPSYSKTAHAALAQMYVDDERFTDYYDRAWPGAAKFLRDAIHIYTGNLHCEPS